jgi:RNA polymerase sigma-70 factor (ECF subfamily)
MIATTTTTTTTTNTTTTATTPREDITTRYEDARRQLGRALQEYADDLDRDTDASPAALEISRQRAAVIARGLEFFGPLRRFVQQEYTLWAGASRVDPPIDDLIAAIYLAAVDHAEDAPNARAFYVWLRRIGRREIRAAIIDNERVARMEQSLETPVATIGEWPDRVIRLIQILADPDGVIPDDVLEQEETRQLLEALLTRLPEQWREVFLLRAIDGWTVEDITAAEGVEAGDVRAMIESSRMVLRAWLEDDRHLVAAGGFA